MIPSARLAGQGRLALDWRVVAALGTVYVVWGSTYLAIRVAVETLPPLHMASIRYLVAGGVMAGLLVARGGVTRLAVSRRELLGAAVVGTALLAAGNGGISVAEQRVPSSLAALIAASIPLWVVVFRALASERVPRGTLVGVVLGFAGVAAIALQGSRENGDAAATLLVVAAAMAWAAGSFLAGRLAMPRDPMVSTTLQLLTGGVILLALGLVVEPAGLPASVEPRSWLALAYLIVFGSLIAFTAYTWLLAHAPVSQVSTYAYVNPVVALLLGWVLLAEPVTPFLLGGAALVVASVALVIRHESGGGRPTAVSPLAAEEGG